MTEETTSFTEYPGVRSVVGKGRGEWGGGDTTGEGELGRETAALGEKDLAYKENIIFQNGVMLTRWNGKGRKKKFSEKGKRNRARQNKEKETHIEG